MNDQDIRRFIRKQFESGDLKNLRKRVKNFIRESGFSKPYQDRAQQMIKEVETKLWNRFKKDYLGGAAEVKGAKARLDAYAKNNLGTIEENVLYNLRRVDQRVISAVYKAVKKGMAGDMNWRDTARNALRKMNMKRAHIETEIRTTQAALDRLTNVERVRHSDMKYLRYAGPSGTERPFCVQHIGAVYSIEEAEELYNRFGEPAITYMGGYNCRHRWVAIEGDMVYKARKGGGRVFAEKGFKERSGEKGIAKLRAKDGRRVILRASADNIKISDAYENGRAVEYKTITRKMKNYEEGVRRQVRTGKKQAGHILIFNQASIGFKGIENGIKKAIEFDRKRQIKQVTVLNNDGSTITKQRENWK